MGHERKRNCRGQFIKAMRPTAPDQRVWLIWSKKWGTWHRRSESGGACGYTSDILQAGLFPFATAAEYNDGWDNTVFHANEKIAEIEHKIADQEQPIADFKRNAAHALAANPATPTPPASGLGEEPTP